jgi:hypothetical protein
MSAGKICKGRANAVHALYGSGGGEKEGRRVKGGEADGTREAGEGGEADGTQVECRRRSRDEVG